MSTELMASLCFVSQSLLQRNVELHQVPKCISAELLDNLVDKNNELFIFSTLRYVFGNRKGKNRFARFPLGYIKQSIHSLKK